MKRINKIISMIIMLSVIVTSSIFVTQVSANTVYESEGNNTLETADSIWNGYDAYGNISSNSDADWWRIDFATEGFANFWLGDMEPGTYFNLHLYVGFNSSLIEAAGVSLNYDNEQELIRCRVTPGVYYFIRISGITSSTNEDSGYHLRVKNYECNPAKLITSEYESEGITNTSSNASTVLNNFSTMGYEASSTHNVLASYAASVLVNNTIVVLNTNAGSGRMILKSDSSTGGMLYANDFTSRPSSSRAIENIPDDRLDDLRCVIFLGSNSGVTHSTYGNLVDMALDKGASCAIGWTDNVSAYDSCQWLAKFTEYCSQGYSVQDAIDMTKSYFNAWDYFPLTSRNIFDVYTGDSPTESIVLGKFQW